MHSLLLKNIGIRVASGGLFQNLNFAINKGDHLALIAKNGGGKTSLLRCLAGLTEPSEGTITRTRGMRIGYVAQGTPPALETLTMRAVIQSALDPSDREYEAWRAELAMDTFETPLDLRNQSFGALSGGWQRLALIARACVHEPDVLVLDEPTNHLDEEKILLLEKWIDDVQHMIPMVISSHDRHFLDNCTNRTLFLRPTLSKLYAHSFTDARRLLAEDDQRDASILEKDMKEAERLRQSANELKNIGINSRSDAAQKKSKQLARRADQLESNLQEAYVERSANIVLNSRDMQARVLLSLDDVVIRKPTGEPLFKTGKLKINRGDRLVILGPNGAGKSQFIKLIHAVVSGKETVPSVVAYPGIVVGYADQQMSQLPDTVSPFEYFSEHFQIGDQRIRTILAGAGFPVAQQTIPIEQFSLGQKARLGLLALRLLQPNFYVLDEPTNHVDIAGQEDLEDEIRAQLATCIIASHDRAFAKALGTRYIRIKQGRLTEVDAPP